MRVLTIVHEQDAGPGVFNDVLSAGGVDVDTWLPVDEPQAPAAAEAYDAIMSFGGSQHPDQEAAHPWIGTEKRFLADALRENVPLLGVCLGAELITEADGTGVRRMSRPEIGWYDVSLTADGAEDPVIGPAGSSFFALEWHSYELVLPPGATALARGENCVQAYRLGDAAWGIQFHAEVTGEDFQYWLDHFGNDPDAVAIGLQTDALARETRARIAAWNDLGRGICERFLQVAAGS